MIFITLGSQKFQFNRILKTIDELIENHIIQEEVFAQIGASDYHPKHYAYTEFVNREEFAEKMNQANIVITHAGTGAIITAVKNDNKVIAVPRLAKYGEHVDDHQLQICDAFEKMNIIAVCREMEQLSEIYQTIETREFAPYVSNTQNFIEEIDQCIQKL